MTKDGVMFCVAFSLLLVLAWMYGDARTEIAQERARAAAMEDQIDTQVHWIRTLQGRLNSRRMDLGLDPIEFTRH